MWSFRLLVVCSFGRVFVFFFRLLVAVRLLAGSCGRLVFCCFGSLFVWSCDRLVILFARSFGRFFVCSSIRFVYFLSF